MPNIKSSVLSVKKDSKRRAVNAAKKSRVRTASRRVLEAVEAGNVEDAQKFLSLAFKVIDKAASDHVLHKNNAAHKKSRLSLKVAAMK